MYSVLVYFWDLSTAFGKMHWASYLLLILWLYEGHGKRWSANLFQALLFDDMQVAKKAGKSDQFYKQLNGVCCKVINFMVELKQGGAVIFL